MRMKRNIKYHRISLHRLPTDVQAEAVPLILGGGDVLMAAETGSGKTGAFCLPVLQIVWETFKDLESGKTGKTSSNSGHQQHCTFFFIFIITCSFFFLMLLIIYSFTLVVKFI